MTKAPPPGSQPGRGPRSGDRAGHRSRTCTLAGPPRRAVRNIRRHRRFPATLDTDRRLRHLTHPRRGVPAGDERHHGGSQGKRRGNYLGDAVLGGGVDQPHAPTLPARRWPARTGPYAASRSSGPRFQLTPRHDRSSDILVSSTPQVVLRLTPVDRGE